ncbi:Hypothetical protein NGAL_HAMBI2605_65600 [Neorhizobium galegae bv. orientalis]|nr:Hypothetical protein NGAL_HAMBI2605_65600 [Neorhizobium galegae bv. orientalis]
MKTLIYAFLTSAVLTSVATAAPVRGGYYEGTNRDETPAEMEAERRYHQSRQGVDHTRTGSIQMDAGAWDEGDYYFGASRPN